MNLLLDSALKATIILAASWLAALALRRASADVRHRIWLMAMIAVALLPAALSIPQSAIPTAARIVVPALATGPQTAQKLPWLAIIWAVGAGIALLRLLAGVVLTARMTRSAKSVAGTLYSDRAATPMTWGFLRPVVILPAYAMEWSVQERDLVLRHEHAHIARRDWLWQMLGSVTTAVFWFHPMMWLASIQLRREAENAVDDRLLANGVTPSDYADCLVDVARQLHGFAVPSVAMPMVRKPELETRVRSILDPARRRAGAGLLVRCAIALAALALVIPIAVTRQKVHAQGRVYKIGQGVSQPTIMYKEEPQYSEEARAEKIEGAVRLQLEISAEGYPENIRVVGPLGYGLDEQAISAVQNWRFKPGMKDGEPVAVYAVIEVNFRLF